MTRRRWWEEGHTAELAQELNNLKGLSTAARTTEAQTFLWTLYNKVDFMYNY